MLLVIHIVLALSSIFFSFYTAFRPTSSKLTLSYVLTVSMLLSAAALALQSDANFGRLCLTGLAFLSVIAIGIILSHRRLAKKELIAE